MFVVTGAELQAVDDRQDVAEREPAVHLIAHLAEDRSDLVLDRVGAVGAFLELTQVGEELLLDEDDQVVPVHRLVMEQVACLVLGHGPGAPAVLRVQDVLVSLAGQLGGRLSVLLLAIQVLQEQQPGRLLDVIQLRLARRRAQEGVYSVKGLLVHGKGIPEGYPR